jgi:lipoprotein-releasing system permease protein
MKWLPFEFALALRYLRPKRTSGSFITLISVVGVMLGVAVLIIVTSVFSGFHNNLKASFFQFSADINVTQFQEISEVDGTGITNIFKVQKLIVDYDALTKTIESTPGVTGVAPMVTGKVLMETEPPFGRPAVDTPELLGVDAERLAKVSQVMRKGELVSGELDLRGNGIVVGANYTRHPFNLRVGDRVLIYPPNSILEMRDAKEVGEELGVLPEEFVVRGVFNAKFARLNSYIFCSLYNAQDLYGMDDGAHSMWVETETPLDLQQLKSDLENKLGLDFRVGTWEDLDPHLLKTVLNEKIITQFLMTFIVVVAAFGITSSLIIFGIQKTKEIGLLKALGATNMQVSVVFIIQSTIVGATGVLLGIGKALLVIHYRNDILQLFRNRGHELFDPQLYGFDQLPAQIIVSDLIVITCVSLLICLLAGLLPAWNAARLRPVEALRSE